MDVVCAAITKVKPHTTYIIGLVQLKSKHEHARTKRQRYVLLFTMHRLGILLRHRYADCVNTHTHTRTIHTQRLSLSPHILLAYIVYLTEHQSLETTKQKNLFNSWPTLYSPHTTQQILIAQSHRHTTIL